MNLVCYPHYAAGGLICDLLNGPPTRSYLAGSSYTGLEHCLFIGDNWEVYDEFDVAEFEQKRLEALTTTPLGSNPWLGTHCHPKLIDLSNFDAAISITTDSTQSQLYRWLRAYNLYFKPQWTEYTGIERVDLMRETAKSYLRPFYHCNTPLLHEIELQDIVKKSSRFWRVCQTFKSDVDFTKVDRWLENNSFLFNYLETPEFNSFMEAEYEVSTKQLYEYQ